MWLEYHDDSLAPTGAPSIVLAGCVEEPPQNESY
jgi:hypothetical protein